MLNLLLVATLAHGSLEGTARDTECHATLVDSAAGNVTWMLTPVVTSRIEDYPCVTVRSRDRIVVRSGGFVQVGKNDQRSYLRPQGKRSHRLYSGTIWIPGITMGLEPVRTVLQHFEARPIKDDTLRGRGPRVRSARLTALIDTLVVPDNVALPASIRLGYQDEPGHYKHNTLPRHRAVSCDEKDADSIAAWVCVTVIRGSTQISAAAATRWGITTQQPANRAVRELSKSWAFDAMVDSLDANGFASHPTWAWSAAVRDGALTEVDPRPSLAACENFKYKLDKRWYKTYTIGLDTLPDGCTTQFDRLTVDEAKFLYGVTCSSIGSDADFHGHINWMPAAYSGRIKYQDESLDGDVDLDLITSDYAGQTTTNANSNLGLHVEFSSLETLYHFTTPWWKRFRAASAKDRSKMLNNENGGSEAIVIGLLGLDAVHGAHAELHPAWGLAIRTSESSGDLEHWALFARNAGNQGSCARDLHYVDTHDNLLTVELPWKVSGDSIYTKVLVDSANFRTWSKWSLRPVQIQIDSGKRVLVRFQLDRPESKALVHGEIRLRWIGQGRSKLSVMSASDAGRLQTRVATRENAKLPTEKLVVSRQQQEVKPDIIAGSVARIRKWGAWVFHHRHKVQVKVEVTQ